MDIAEYYRPLEKSEREAFAKRLKTSVAYIENHWLPRRKIPKKPTMKAIPEASGGQVSYREVVEYFYFCDEDKAA